VNYIEVAYTVLADYDKPLSVKDIVTIAMERNLIMTAGNDPKAAIATSLYRDIRRRGSNSLFQVNRGKFRINKTTKETGSNNHFEKKRIYKNKSIYKWGKTTKSVFVCYRESDPYEQYCPREHLRVIMDTIANLLVDNLQIDSGMIASALENKLVISERIFNRRTEIYKIFMALAILQIEGLISGENRNHKTYSTNVSIQQLKKWVNTQV
jgi:hypothetical protein